MTEDEARTAELVRAIEAEDADGALLTREDRDQAEARARAAVAGLSGARADDRFIATRGEFAAARLATRHPGIASLLARSRWPVWIGVVLPLLALGAGFLANEFGTARRLDLLAVPLLGVIAWNLLAYAAIAAGALTGRGRLASDPVSGTVARLAGFGRRDFDRGSALHRAADGFQRRWSRRAAPLANARIARTLHLGAALFAAGLIGGIYVRALVIEYRAGWESTFLGPEAVHGLLSLVLGPASSATGVAIPPVNEMAAMRWKSALAGAAGGGVNAGPWIHLYTTTIAALVIFPRLVMAAWQGVQAIRLARHFPGLGRDDFYTRRLLRASGARPASARVTPYAYNPGEETRRRLSAALRAALGDGAELRFDEAIAYGSEDEWLAAHPPRPEDDYHLLLFTLSATPEAENHGALTRALAARIAAEHPGTVLAAIVDESPFRAHFAGQAGLDARVATRIAAWRTVLGEAGVTPLALDLSDPLDDTLAQRLESGLLPDGAMHG